MLLVHLLFACAPDPGADKPGRPDRPSEVDTGDEDRDTADTGSDGEDTGGGTEPGDRDGDGVGAFEGDCDDLDPAVHPGAAEVCDGVDQDCDGVADDGPDAPAWYADADGDGYGDDAAASWRCDVGPAGRVDNDLDCDDGAASLPLWVAVDGDGVGTFADPMGGIQDALDASDGCVLLHPGAYDEAVSMPPDATLRGVGGSASTSLTRPDPGSVVTAKLVGTVTLRGLTIHGGTGTHFDTVDWDGLTACEHRGGGLLADGSDVVLRDVVFQDNDVTGVRAGEDDGCAYLETSEGGGARTGVATLEDVRFVGNVADAGGGFWGSGVVGAGVVLEANRATTWGGGAYVLSMPQTGNFGLDVHGLYANGNDAPAGSALSGGEVHVSLGAFVGNVGGAAVDAQGGIQLEDVRFQENAWGALGGTGPGMYELLRVAFVGEAMPSAQSAVVDLHNVGLVADHVLVSSAGGNAFHLEGFALISHLTVVGADVALWLETESAVRISSSILVGNATGVDLRGEGTPEIAYTDVWGNGADWVGLADPTGTDGNVSVDPGFVAWTPGGDPADQDLHLGAASVCVDAGDPAEVDADGTRADMGAFGGPAAAGGDWGASCTESACP